MKRRPCIMVVEDNQQMMRMLNRTLQLEGYGVAMVADGSSALTMLEERRPDLVILDILMPDLDGFEVLELIRRRCSVPVITLTARSKEISLGKHRSTDSDDYVRMPFHTRELVACVEAKLQ